MDTPTLENWFIGENDMLYGEIHNDLRFMNGDIVITSRVISLDLEKRIAVTKNTNYKLGKPLANDTTGSKTKN